MTVLALAQAFSTRKAQMCADSNSGMIQKASPQGPHAEHTLAMTVLHIADNANLQPVTGIQMTGGGVELLKYQGEPIGGTFVVQQIYDSYK